MYDKPNICSVYEARLELFLKIYKPKGKRPLSGVKGVDGSNLPPCKSVLLQQIKRVNVVCSTWNQAHETNPSIISPDGNGWEILNGKYALTQFEGDMVPPTLEEITCQENAETEENENIESDYDSSDEELSSEDE